MTADEEALAFITHLEEAAPVKVAAAQTNTSLALAAQVDYIELVEWLATHPGASHAEIGHAYGKPAGWFATVLVTQEFQSTLEPHRSRIQNPGVTSSIEERMQAMLVRSLDIVHAKMSAGTGDAMLALEAAKLSTKALGYGAAGRDQGRPVESTSLESLADRLTALVTSKRGGAIGSVPAATELVVDVTPRDPQ